MNAQSYVISAIQLLQKEFGIYSIVTPAEFDAMYRWWEKRIPLNLIRQTAADVLKRRTGRGKETPGIMNLVAPLRRSFSRYKEEQIGAGGRLDVSQSLEAERNRFLQNPPEEIADLVARHLKEKVKIDTDVMERFFCELLDQFRTDEELTRKTDLFAMHLSPVLRTDSLLRRYRLNLLISRFSIPDFDDHTGEDIERL